MDQANNPLHRKVKPLVQESFTEISFDEHHRIIIARWKGVLSLDQVREGCSFMTDFIKKHQLIHHLSDHTDLRTLSPDVQKYLSQTWFFEVERAGLRKIAVRLAKDIFAQATVKRVNTVEKYGELQIEVFPSCESAIEWLTESKS